VGQVSNLSQPAFGPSKARKTAALWGRLAACGRLAVGLVGLRNQPPYTVRLHMQFGREPCFRPCGRFSIGLGANAPKFRIPQWFEEVPVQR